MAERQHRLSFAQERMWFLHQAAPHGAQQHIGLPLRLAGPLDVAALGTALSAVVARHEPLRTTVASGDAGAVQQVHPPAPVPLPVVDLAGTAAGSGLHRALAGSAARPFDLVHGPVLRAVLYRLAPTEHVLQLVVHHIAFDGWSTGILLRELAAGYQAACQGRPPSSAPLPVSYRDLATAQRARLAAGAMDEGLGYWRDRLAGMAPLRLPAQPGAAAPHAGPAASHQFAVPAEVTGRLHALGRRHDATLFMVLVAATSALLSWYTGSGDIAVATVVPGRDRVESEPLIGLFVNTVVLRCQVDDELPFTALLARAREAVLDGFAHADVPFDQVVDQVRAPRHGGRTPLVPAMVVLQNPPPAPGRWAQLEVSDVAAVPGEAGGQFDLEVQFLDHSGTDPGGGLAGSLSYDPGRFDPPAAARLAGHLAAVLAAVGSNPRRPLWRLWPASRAGQAHPALAGPGSDGGPGPAGGSGPTVVSLFAAQVRAHPDQPAVCAGRQSLTYRQLAERAARLAGQLRRHGLRRGDRVCVVAEPGVDAVVGFVALATIGAGCTGLEPDLPPRRLRQVLADSRPALVLAGPGTGQVDLAGVPVLHISELAGAVAHVPELPGPGPDDPLCTVYTSGTTGRPKGVVLTHRNLTNLIAWHQRVLGGGPGTRFGQVASLSFDAAGWEIWSALCLGSCLCVADPPLRRDPRALGAWIAAQQLTGCFLTTALGRQVLRGGALAAAHRLRHLLIGGEKAAAPPAGLPFTLLNVYGPTEAGVLASWFDLTGWAAAPGGDGPPIGQPLDGVRAYLLDRHLRAVPPGRVAELYLGGPGVAQGYLGQPGLTAARFVADPYGPPGARMYRTGDLASATAQTPLRFHGRRDRQVKIRGTRVELDEIERVLAGHERVAEAAVVAPAGPHGQPTLVAYLAPVAGARLDPAELRSWLRQRLPEPMVPARIATLAALPRTRTGKTDLPALAARPVPEPTADPAGAVPRTDTERLVHRQWAAVLGTGAVGVHENFFDAGGCSITLLDLRARLEPCYGGELPIALLFEHTTIAAMARILDQRRTAAAAGTHAEGDYRL